MTALSITDPEAAFAYIQQLELPPPPATLRGSTAEVAELGGDGARAVALGSQVTEFAPGLTRQVRKDVLNSFLMAQLAANSLLRTEGGGTEQWYERFFYVLANSGWNVERGPETRRDLSGSPERVHREIVPVVTDTLGQDVAKTSLVVAALKALATVPADRPWLALLDRESRRGSAHQFQIAHVAAVGADRSRDRLTSFELTTTQSSTRVLFMRFSEASASFRHSASTLTVNEPVFARLRDLVEDRIRYQLATFMESIEL